MPNSVYEEKKHFNIIDVMIIIGALLIIVGIIFRAQIIDVFVNNGKQTTYTVTFEADAVPNAISENILDGNTVIWVEKSAQLGVLSDLKKEAAVIYVPNTSVSEGKTYNDGTYSKVTSSDMTRIVGVFTAQGNSNDGCYVNGTDFLASGMTLTLATPTVEFQVVITSISGQ